jgi:hypothetical protein
MRLQSLNIKPLLIAIALSLPGLAMAETFPCDRGSMCNIQPSLSLDYPNQSRAFESDDNVVIATFMKGVDLSENQRYAISQVVQNQMPIILQQLRLLNDAHAILREMAVSKQYNETDAITLINRIADSSATLAFLQAEREYQVYTLLSPEQVNQFDKLHE